jgi:hypothetical protein
MKLLRPTRRKFIYKGTPMKNLLRYFLVSVGLLATPALATDFLYDPGTSNNGLIVSALTIESTELNSLAAAAVATSTVINTTGIVTNSNTGQGVWGSVVFTAGTFGAACTAGANVAGWFLSSVDGTTFEAANVALARSPDFIVALPTGTTAGTFKSQLIRIPAEKFKVSLQNNCTASGGGGALAASANTIALAVIAVKY